MSQVSNAGAKERNERLLFAKDARSPARATARRPRQGCSMLRFQVFTRYSRLVCLAGVVAEGSPFISSIASGLPFFTVKFCVLLRHSIVVSPPSTNAERQESARASESRQEGGESDGGAEITVGANDTPKQRCQHRPLPALVGGPPLNPAGGPGDLFHELPRGRRLLRKGDTFHRRSSGFVLRVVAALSESLG